jgi:hypothetical protein
MPAPPKTSQRCDQRGSENPACDQQWVAQLSRRRLRRKQPAVKSSQGSASKAKHLSDPAIHQSHSIASLREAFDAMAFHLHNGVNGGDDDVMFQNPITGHTLRWKFHDGPMAGKSFDHTFTRHGSVMFREVDGDPNAKPGAADQYQVASLGQDVHTVSYLSNSGHTLTVVLDYRTRKLVAFASNGDSLTMQHGTFEPLGSAPR